MLQTLPLPVSACALTALELAADHPDFVGRKRAAQAVVSICRPVYYETTESIIKAAFGMPQPTKASFDAFNILRALLLADSVEAMERGVYDPEYDCVRTVRSGQIRNTKTTLDRLDRDMFSSWAGATRAHVRSYVVRHESALVGEQRSLRMQALKGDHSLTPEAYLAMLLRLATLAGVVTTEEVEQRLETNDTDTLFRRLATAYDGSLDCFIVMFQEYRRYLELGGNPGRNDTFDLEFFVYLNARGRRHTFVTKDRKWVRLAEKALPGRVVTIEDLVGSAYR